MVANLPASARPGAGDPATELRERGFTLVEHESAVADWTDQVEIDQVHRDEVRELFRSLAGCDNVVVYPGIIRSPYSAQHMADYAPIEFVHSDFTDDYHGMVIEADRPYQEFLRPNLERAGLTRDDLAGASRIAMLQLWRNTGPRWPDAPFALCDARDVPLRRLLPFVIPEYGGLRLEFEIFAALPPGEGDVDRWYTYPGMQRHEVIALRTFDSDRARSGEPFWTLHSAFIDPTAPPDTSGTVPRRQSLEMRALCIWH